MLDCDGRGTNRSVIAGVNWVVDQVRANPGQLAVANMSLSGGTGSKAGSCTSPALNVAVCNAIAAGIPFAVAAGNDGHDACYNTPASAPPALTVMASGFLGGSRADANQDFMPVWSNSGPCADLFAPGMGIVSAVRTASRAPAITAAPTARQWRTARRRAYRADPVGTSGLDAGADRRRHPGPRNSRQHVLRAVGAPDGGHAEQVPVHGHGHDDATAARDVHVPW